MASATDYEHIFMLLSSTVAGQALAVALDLKIADRIDAGSGDPADLAQSLGADRDNLTRLLQALAALGLCIEDDNGHFALTDVGALLRTTDPNSLANLAELNVVRIGDLVTWHEMKSSVLTGKCAFKHRNGVDFFEYLSARPELYQMFNLAMRQGSKLVAKDIAEVYDFSKAATIIDIGGNDGTLLATILAAHPRLTGALFDTAGGVAEAQATLDEAQVASRCTVTVGDFFQSVPGVADVYILKSVLHDWDDSAAHEILLSCRRAIPDDGRLLIIEPVLDKSASSTVYARLSDLNMMVALGGRERTREDFEELCRGSGFEVTQVRRLDQLDLSLIEAAPTAMPTAIQQ
ncbi:methyltransferase [Saccharopolyspora phatthalungensis]|uniref:SAM-dependent methyltransferase n=1 Tax=Saccharopolyspora phatthalungensis TaxID=664693 RepID=A0A840QAL1_9PSEU|nr:methyltransferase [Saccharopolyspora phatthalungensis]MBB5156860.1 SAM-dependent methyltransferase [Saccharopolyspora phatthalungensis]